jgi:hypothetical protein
MRLLASVRSASIMFAAVLLVTSGTASGQDYTFPATGGAGMEYGSFPPDSLVPIYTPVPAPTSVSLSINYNGQTYLSSQTNGDTTIFQNVPTAVQILGVGSPYWPNFFSFSQEIVIVTVPTDGQGLDQITFSGLGPLGKEGAEGGVVIEAPLGTLSTSTELPPNLDAFLQYAQTNDAGLWGISALGYPYNGNAGGLIGPDAAPEPGSFWLLAIGATACAALRRFSRARRCAGCEAC